MNYHGNYCGPGWSNGEYQSSVVGDRSATDEFDESCRAHDAAYATGANLREADLRFYRENVGRGFKRSAAAVLVGAQGLARAIDKHNPRVIKEIESMQKRNLRGSAVPNKSAKSVNRDNVSQAVGSQITRLTPPTSIGTAVRITKPKVVRSTESATMSGSDFIATVEGQGVSTFGLGKSALLSPAYFQSTMLGNLARSFEKYRWTHLRVHYVPKVGTTTSGQVILCSQRSVSEPGLQPEGGNFLPRAMSQGNASFTPVWAPTYIDIDCGVDWMLVDPTTTVDLDDSIHEELQVYSQVGSSGQVGYLIAEYTIQFKEPIYQPHATTIPVSTGPGARVSFVDNAGINAVNDDWVLNDSAGTLGLSNVQNGTIYRAVFDLQGSAAATGATFSNLLNSNLFFHATTTSTTNVNVNTAMVGGLTLYFVVAGTTVECYTSLEAAVNGNGTGQLFYRTATTVAGTYLFDVALVRTGIAQIATQQ